MKIHALIKSKQDQKSCMSVVKCLFSAKEWKLDMYCFPILGVEISVGQQKTFIIHVVKLKIIDALLSNPTTPQAF